MTAPYRKRTPARGAASTLALAIALAGGTALAQGEGPGATTVKIGAQPLDQALTELGAQAGVQIVVVSEDAAGLRARPIEGRFTGEEAVDLLLKDSGLIQRRINDRTIVIGSPERLAADAQASWLRFAQVDTSARGVAEPATVGDDVADDDETAYETIETIVVTGTNIRGVGTSASPVLRFDREVIEQSGAATVADFIQRAIPQNFAAGAAEDTAFTGRGGAEFNGAGGTGVNIRGLGTDSTLVLVNGKRVASAGAGSFVDISLIPLSAIERVDVLTDGASAIYGSDAIGGVVNFVLADEYEGAETRLRFGTATDGDASEYQVGQSLGKNWDSGHAFVSYEFYQRDALDSADRTLTVDGFDPLDILPEQTRHSFFFSGAQDIANSASAYATVLYSDRGADRNTTPSPGFEEFNLSNTKQLNAVLGSRIEISEDWLADFSGTFSRADSNSRVFQFANPGVVAGRNDFETESWIVDGKFEGPIANAPGGEARLALGGQYRSDNLAAEISTGLLPTSDRDVYAIFGEIFLPLIGGDNRWSGFEKLELSLAGRFEDYSDFGSSADPKIGLLYSPVDGLNLRSTWGTSFRAPLLIELGTSGNSIILFDSPDPSATLGTSLAAVLQGNNASLTPEEATTWTVGVDFQPSFLPGFDLSMTYFSIEFDERIVSPNTDQLINSLSDPALGAIVDRNFNQADLDMLIAEALAVGNLLDFSFGQQGAASVVEVIVDGRLQNLAQTSLDGLDFDVLYSIESGFGYWTFSFAGTFLFNLSERFTAELPSTDVLGQVFRPPELRFRSGISWSHNGIGANAFVNYVDSLVDPRSTPSTSIDSFTTVDFQVNVRLGELSDSSILDGMSIYVSIINAFDKQPPFVADPFANLNFDPENHDILGRFVAVGLTHRW